MYELLFMTKAGPARESVKLIKTVCAEIFRSHPAAKIRGVKTLGDRIMGAPVQKAGVKYQVGRVLQIDVFSDPTVHDTVRRAIQNPDLKNDVFRFVIHKAKHDY